MSIVNNEVDFKGLRLMIDELIPINARMADRLRKEYIKMIQPGKLARFLLHEPAIIRTPGVYGCSEFGFCLEKTILDRRIGSGEPMNIKMLIGRLLHAHYFPKLIWMFYAEMNNFDKSIPQWEAKAYYKYDREGIPVKFEIDGHCDGDDQIGDRIFEFKSTWTNRVFQRGDYLTEIYIDQANAYACILGRKTFVVVILHLFDMESDDIITIIEGEADQEAFEDWLRRPFQVHQALEHNADLIGPEYKWECEGCGRYPICPHHADQFKVTAMIPFTKAQVPVELMREFELLLARKKIEYNRKQKVYVLKDDTKVVSVDI